MAKPKKVRVVRKKGIEDLPVRDVETAETHTITGGADGKVVHSDLQIVKVVDKSSPILF